MKKTFIEECQELKQAFQALLSAVTQPFIEIWQRWRKR